MLTHVLLFFFFFLLLKICPAHCCDTLSFMSAPVPNANGAMYRIGVKHFFQQKSFIQKCWLTSINKGTTAKCFIFPKNLYFCTSSLILQQVTIFISALFYLLDPDSHPPSESRRSSVMRIRTRNTAVVKRKNPRPLLFPSGTKVARTSSYFQQTKLKQQEEALTLLILNFCEK